MVISGYHLTDLIKYSYNFFVLQSSEWIKVRIQQMEPDLMEVGTTLEEAKQLRREHDELLYKLGVRSTFISLVVDVTQNCVMLVRLSKVCRFNVN